MHGLAYLATYLNYKHLQGQHNQQRHAGSAAATAGFFAGDPTKSTIEQIFEGSSLEVKQLAARTGIIATDANSMDYIKNKFDTPENSIATNTQRREDPDLNFTNVRDQVIKAQTGWGRNTAQSNPEKTAHELIIQNETYKYKADPKKGITDHDVRSSVQHSLGEISGIMEKMTGKQQWQRFVGSGTGYDAIKDAPNLTAKERAVLERLAPKYTKSKGVYGAQMKNAIDKLTEKERIMVHKMSHKIGAHDVTVDIISDALREYKSDKFDYELQQAEHAQGGRRLDWDKKAAIRKKVYSEVGAMEEKALGVLKKTRPIGAHEKPVDFAERVIGSSAFKKAVPDIIGKTTSVSTLQTPIIDYTQTIALQDAGPEFKKQAIRRFSKSWDRANHKFYGKVENAFTIIHPTHLKEKWEAASSKHGNVKEALYHGTDLKAARGINQTGFNVSITKAGKMLGPGVYIARSSSKSMQYISTQFSRYGDTDGVILESKVAMDSVVDWNDLPKWHAEFSKVNPQFNTMFAPKDRTGYDIYGKKRYSPIVNDEWAIHDPAAVLPTHWLDVKRSANQMP